jgi:hypothetical protein
MKTRLFLAALCIFLLPLCFAPSSSQFSAYASGYVIAFGELTDEPCECGTPNCGGGDCDATHATSQPPGKDTSLGSESLIILAALMLWLRFRAN